MSSILKALKKLEQEKSGRFPDSLKIDTDILRTVDSSRRLAPFVLVLLLLLVFGVGATVAVFFMKKTTATQATTKLSPALTAKSIPPQVPPSLIKPETLPAEIVVVPARKEPSGELSRKQQKKPAGAVKEADGNVKKKIGTADSGSSIIPKEALPAAADVPTLRVSGIAFQNSAADSMAIVNGIPVANGSIIEGITVEEIRKDRVLFQRDGEKFEIQLGQSNR